MTAGNQLFQRNRVVGQGLGKHIAEHPLRPDMVQPAKPEGASLLAQSENRQTLRFVLRYATIPAAKLPAVHAIDDEVDWHRNHGLILECHELQWRDSLRL